MLSKSFQVVMVGFLSVSGVWQGGKQIMKSQPALAHGERVEAEYEKNNFTADKPPRPKQGLVALQKKLHYPELAKKAGIEGRVVLDVHISRNGDIRDIKVKESLGKSGCDEAAIAAVRVVEWNPGVKKNKAVSSWVSIPVVFKLPKKKKQKSILFDTPPRIVGGLAGLYSHLRYPEIAKKAGVQGRVVVEVHIAKNGALKAARVVETFGDAGCDQAALDAAKKVKWTPATLKGQPIAAYVEIPVVFKLK